MTHLTTDPRRRPAIRGGLLALLAAALFGASTPLVQRFGVGIGAFGTAALLYAGAAIAGALLRQPIGIEDVLIGATYAFHLVTAIKEFGPHQSDVTRTGVIFSYVFVALMHIVFLLMILLIVSGNYAGIADYFRAVWARAQAAYGATLGWITNSLVPALRHLWEDLRPSWAGNATAASGGTL